MPPLTASIVNIIAEMARMYQREIQFSPPANTRTLQKKEASKNTPKKQSENPKERG